MDDAPVGGRIEGEPAKPFEAFTVYRELGPRRSTAEVARRLGKSRGLIQRWSAEHRWVERAAEWDDHADAQARERDLVEREQARRLMNSDHATLGRAALIVASKKLAMFDDTSATTEGREAARRAIEAVSVSELVRLMESGAKLERLARGEASERVGIREARRWVDRMIPIALAHIPEASQEAFLVDLEAEFAAPGGGST